MIKKWFSNLATTFKKKSVATLAFEHFNSIHETHVYLHTGGDVIHIGWYCRGGTHRGTHYTGSVSPEYLVFIETKLPMNPNTSTKDLLKARTDFELQKLISERWLSQS